MSIPESSQESYSCLQGNVKVSSNWFRYKRFMFPDTALKSQITIIKLFTLLNSYCHREQIDYLGHIYFVYPKLNPVYLTGQAISKLQISNDQNISITFECFALFYLFWILNFGHWYLFEIRILVFGIFIIFISE